jgi:hypothetical protein
MNEHYEVSGVFESYEHALNWVRNKQSNYEAENGIKNISDNLMLNMTDLKVVSQLKSDHSFSIILFFKPSLKADKWVVWVPSETQMYGITAIKGLYDYAEYANNKLRKNGFEKEN